MIIKWKNKEKRVNDLIPADYNPRRLTDPQREELTKIIEKFGFVEPVIINTNNKVIGGHQRLKVLNDLGIDKVSVCEPNRQLTEDEEKELNLRLNKNTGEWDFKMLADFSKDMLKDVGFQSFEMDKIFALKISDKDNEAPEQPDQTDIVIGDVFRLGKNVVMCGDSTNTNHIAVLMGERKADMLLTDPPYNVDYTGKTKDALKIENDSKTDEEFRIFLKDAFQSADMVMKGGGVFYIWHADLEGYNFRGACHDIGWKVRQCLIWNKNCMVMGRQDYHWKHEPCLYGWKKGDGHLWNADRSHTTILNFDRPSRSSSHPTMKPVELFSYLIRNNTRYEDIVLDLFLGSGTSVIACEKTNRICYGMEYDPKYVDVIIKRWEEFTGNKAERVENGN